MPDLVAKAISADGKKVVGLVGTRMVTTGSTYQTHLGLRGIQVLAPEPAEADEMDQIIFRELIYGNINPGSQKRVLTILGNLASRGCEGVILASSEAPLLITTENTPLPLYDAADILAQGAVRAAMEAPAR
jgi:aspartate racemase